jgi:hypothetical protein
MTPNSLELSRLAHDAPSIFAHEWQGINNFSVRAPGRLQRDVRQPQQSQDYPRNLVGSQRLRQFHAGGSTLLETEIAFAETFSKGHCSGKTPSQEVTSRLVCRAHVWD